MGCLCQVGSPRSKQIQNFWLHFRNLHIKWRKKHLMNICEQSTLRESTNFWGVQYECCIKKQQFTVFYWLYKMSLISSCIFSKWFRSFWLEKIHRTRDIVPSKRLSSLFGLCLPLYKFRRCGLWSRHLYACPDKETWNLEELMSAFTIKIRCYP